MRKGVIILIILAGIFYLWGQKKLPSKPEGVFCTQEALMCPDGSYVGRQGDKCAFTACPNTGPYQGMTFKQGSNLFLRIGAPSSTTEEVTYALPLVMQTPEIPEPSIGKYISVTGKFLDGNNFQVESFKETTKDNKSGENITLSMGQTGYAGGIRITLNKVVSDSRCPSDVTCITAGFASFEVTLKSDTDEEKVTLTSENKSHPFDAYKVSITKVEPVPVSSKKIDASKYLVTFKVENL